jgi:hypothetical protein
VPRQPRVITLNIPSAITDNRCFACVFACVLLVQAVSGRWPLNVRQQHNPCSCTRLHVAFRLHPPITEEYPRSRVHLVAPLLRRDLPRRASLPPASLSLRWQWLAQKRCAPDRHIFGCHTLTNIHFVSPTTQKSLTNTTAVAAGPQRSSQKEFCGDFAFVRWAQHERCGAEISTVLISRCLPFRVAVSSPSLSCLSHRTGGGCHPVSVCIQSLRRA